MTIMTKYMLAVAHESFYNLVDFFTIYDFLIGIRMQITQNMPQSKIITAKYNITVRQNDVFGQIQGHPAIENTPPPMMKY